MRRRDIACFVASLILLVCIYREVKRNAPASTGNCASHSADSLAPIVIMAKVSTDRLGSLGGTGHWFHFFERILFHLDEASEKIWYSGHKIMYIAFQESRSATSIGPFGRLLLSAVVTGGHVDTIVIGFADSIQFDGETVHIEHFRKTFIIDTTVTTPFSFMESSDAAHKGRFPSCFRNVLQMNWKSVERLNWFGGVAESFHSFRAAVAKLCHFSADVFESRAPIIHWNSSSTGDDLNRAEANVRRKILRGIRNYQSLIVPPVVELSDQSVKRVVIYQRDSTRSFVECQNLARSFRRLLNDTGQNRFGGHLSSSKKSERWAVDVVLHSNDRSPCDLVKDLATATVLVTPHGFQSLLLLFQPQASMLVEIYPHLYVKPEVYGFVQAGLRQHVGLPRSYMWEESTSTVDGVRGMLSMLRRQGALDPEICIHSAACRYLARFQNVEMSTSFLNKVVDFIETHFI